MAEDEIKTDLPPVDGEVKPEEGQDLPPVEEARHNSRRSGN